MKPLLGNENLQITGTHAYIVAGDTGSGRARLIEHIATAALCQEKSPCGVCSHCVKMEHQTHPDFQTYGLEKSLTVEQVRDLRKNVLVRPNEANYAVHVIYQADKLLVGGQNALLKILEEPPSHGIFILVTEESGDVLETILSRCRKLTLRPLSLTQTVAYLQNRFPTHPDIQGLAERCGGFLGKAIEEVEPKKSAPQQDTAEQFHMGVKKRTKLPSKKEKAPPLADDKLQEVATKIAKNMMNRQELPLLESCLTLEKLDKSTLLQILDQMKVIISEKLITHKDPHLYHCLKLTTEVETAVYSNVGGGQLIGWLTAATMKSSKGGYQ